MLLIDSLAYASRFRPVHPGKKVLITVSLLILAVALQSITVGILLVVGMGILSVWGGGTPFRLYVRLLKIPLVFIGLSLIAIVVNVVPVAAGGTSLGPGPSAGYAASAGLGVYAGFGIPGSGISGPGVSVSLGSIAFVITAEGLYRGARLAASAFGAVSCLYFLALSTPLTDIFYVLEKLKCPFLIIELMLLIYRFVFILWSVAGELGKAADSRLGNLDFKTAVRTSGQMFATLFIRALKRSSAIYDAMESRGYNGRINVLPGFRPKDRKKRDGEEHE